MKNHVILLSVGTDECQSLALVLNQPSEKIIIRKNTTSEPHSATSVKICVKYI